MEGGIKPNFCDTFVQLSGESGRAYPGIRYTNAIFLGGQWV